MIPGFKEVMRQTEEFLLVLRGELIVKKATWILPEDGVEWQLILVIPEVAHDRFIAYNAVQEALRSCGEIEFDINDIRVEKADKHHALPYKVVETI